MISNILKFDILAFACFALLANSLWAQAPDAKITFDDHVKPILNQRCSSCHSSGKKEADLDVTNYTALMLGGGSGEVISAGAATDSYLYKLITHEESPEMPPSGTKIPDAEIKMIADWINAGALENAGSKPRATKPKMDLAMNGDATVRPEIIAEPLLMPLEPVIKTARPAATAIATSPWAKVAAIAAPKQVLLYSTETLDLLGVLPMEEGIAHSLKFSRNGSLLVGGGGKDGQLGTVVVWDVKTGERVTTVAEELDAVLAADISSNHELVALGGPSKWVKVFSVVDGSLRNEINKHTDWVTAIEFSPDGKLLATGDRNGGLHVWETSTGAERYTLAGHTAAITGISWRADSLILASASEDTTVRTWEMNKGAVVKNWGAHGGGVTSIEFLRDGNLVSCGRDKVAKTWNQDGGQLLQFPGLADVAVAISYCDETARVIVADWTGEIRVFNGADGVEIGKLIANPPTLAERLTNSQTALNVAQQKRTPLIAAFEQTKTKLSEVTTALSTTQQSATQMQTKIAEMQKQLATIKQQLESTAAQKTAWQTELTATGNALPLIHQTLTKAIETATALPADEELKQTVLQLETKQTTLTARVTELETLVTKTNEEETVVKSKMDQMTASMNAEQQQLDKLNAEVAQLQTQIEPLTKQVAEETQAVTLVQQEVETLEQQIAKWNRNLEFIAQLEHLNGDLEQTETVIVEREAIVAEAEQKVQAAQTEAEQAKQAKDAIEAEAQKIRQQILQLRGG